MKSWTKLTAIIFMTLLMSPAWLVKAAEKDMTIVGGGSGGLWAIITEGVGETVRRSFDGARVTTEPGKDGPNQMLINKGDVQFGIGSDTLTLRGLKGEKPFKGKQDKLRLVAVISPSQAAQFFVDNKTGVKSLSDISEKKTPLKITVNRQGSVIELLSEELLNAINASYKDIAAWGGKVNKIPGPEAMELWDAGQMDAIIEVSQFPSSRFVELGQKHDLTLLPLDQKTIDVLVENLGATPAKIPAGTYPFQNEDVDTVNTQLLLLTNADTPDELVEGVLSSMVQNLDYLHNVHAALKDMSPETMQVNDKIPFHPAAEKFYKNLKK